MFVQVLIIFALLFLGALTLGSALFITRSSRLKIDQRISLAVHIKQRNAEDATLQGWMRANLKWLDVHTKRFFAFGISNNWGMKTGSRMLVVVALISAASMFTLFHLGVGLPDWLTIPICLFAAFIVPHMILRREQKAAERKFTDNFPDAIDTVTRIIRSGLPATAAMRTVGDDTAEPVGSVFTKIANQMKIGIPLGEALTVASNHIALADFRFFAVAINLQYSTGGNLVFTLEMLSEIIRKRRAVRSKAKAVTAEIRLSAYVLGSLPFLTVGGLLLIQPDYLAPLIEDPRGHVILGMAAAGLGLSVLSMQKMMASITNG
jgi:tight adherence protein B